MNLRAAILLGFMLSLTGCMGSQTGKALNSLDTITQEDKEEEAWFNSFYGKEHCGVTQGHCAPGQKPSESGTGGWWGVGGTPDGQAGHHDSGYGW